MLRVLGFLHDARELRLHWFQASPETEMLRVTTLRLPETSRTTSTAESLVQLQGKKGGGSLQKYGCSGCFFAPPFRLTLHFLCVLLPKVGSVVALEILGAWATNAQACRCEIEHGPRLIFGAVRESEVAGHSR